MRNTVRSLAIALAAVPSGCGGTSAAGGGDGATTASVVLCDGSSALRFAGVSGGGNETGMPRVATELGWSFILVDGHCQVWSMTRPDGAVRTGMLDSAKAAAFVQDFRLGQWGGSISQGGGCSDAGTLGLRFGEQRASASCTTTWLTTAYDDWLRSLYESASDVVGPVRYSLTDAGGDGWVMGNTALASTWPLSTDPAALIVSVADEGQAEPRIATENDADALRGARKTYLPHADGPLGPWLRIPISSSQGSAPRYFNLAMRDIVPFENNGRMDTDGFFQ